MPRRTGLCCFPWRTLGSASPKSITKPCFGNSARSRIRCRNDTAARDWDSRCAAILPCCWAAAFGSTFSGRIPAIYVGKAVSAEDADKLPAPEFHRIPILILEGNVETARVLESYLRSTEFQPILAANVAQAEVWTARHAPGAVVSDVYVGDDHTWGFLSRLRERLPDLPIITTSIF